MNYIADKLSITEGELAYRIFNLLVEAGSKRFLAFGAFTAFERVLLENGYEGVALRSSPSDCGRFGKRTEIVGVYGDDPRFVPLLDGYSVRNVTIPEIFNQYGGPYAAVIIGNTGVDRAIWYHKLIQDSLPKVYLISEDGHNEGVIHQAVDRGYKATDCGDWLMMVKE